MDYRHLKPAIFAVIFVTSLLLLQAPAAKAEINIQRSSDGGKTWNHVGHDTASLGVKAVSASGAECEDAVIGKTASSSSLLQQRRVPFANPGSNATQQTFMRFSNPNNSSTQVEVYGIDDTGTPNRSGPISFTLNAEASLQFTAQDMESGNTSKGLTGSFCDGAGKWQLIVRSDKSIEVMSLIRAPGGFLTSLNEVVPSSGDDRLVYFVNRASEPSQQTFLRIVNREATSGTVTISAIDDGGNAGASDITLSLAANDSQQMTSQDLENGNTSKGLVGAFGDGEGNWRITVNSTLNLDVMNLIRLPGGYLLNLGGIAPGTGNARNLNYVEPADESLRTSSVRVINTANAVATVTVTATDDNGAIAPKGEVIFTLAPLAAREITISDLENGNVDEGITGMLGDGSGRWRMTVSSTHTLEVMSLVETQDGFLTNLSRAAPATASSHKISVFNPGSNTSRRSTLRIANDGSAQAAITISGFDDAGQSGESDVTLDLSAGRSISISASDLENGNTNLGLIGALGNGTGKWRLTINANTSIQVQGLLDTPAGFITNLSRATEDQTTEPAPKSKGLTSFETNISSVIQGKCVACHKSGGAAGSTSLVYVSDSTAGYKQTNYDTLKSYIDAGNGNTLLNKGRGVGHGGGQQFSSDSQEFSDFSDFVDLLGEDVSASGFTGEYWEGVTFASPTKTLRRASLLLRGDVPTKDEERAITSGGEVALRDTIRGLMEGDGFHEFLTRGANDRLLTDKFLVNTAAFIVSDPNGRYFPIAAAHQYEANFAAGGNTAPQDRTWKDHWQWGLARAPVELIAHIIEEDRNYQEVVTADYMMVNYWSNKFLDAGAKFDGEDPRVFKPGKNNAQIVNDQLLVSEYTNKFGVKISSHGPYLDYPQAGVLNTHAFLNRYPTTETNRNRARARWTYLHFLGVDIEKSAERTVDAEALADKNNPTLNNPACTSCHAIHDPVAGTFQNYDEAGYYRSGNLGIDSLPMSYKENSEEYTQGDTWFKDMRSAGFEGQLASSQDNSLEWLGQVISSQDRYSEAAIKFWWPSLMGSLALEAPVASEDKDFDINLAAFEAQNSFIKGLGKKFTKGIEGGAAYNGKDLLTSMVLSEWFRADEVENSNVRSRLVNEIGTRRLLTPEELEKKSLSLLGWRWGQYAGWSQDQSNSFFNEYSHLRKLYNTYYGGTNSEGITVRSSALTALMVNVAEKQALDMACPAIMADFERPEGNRLLLNGIDSRTTPGTETIQDFTVDAISESEAGTYSFKSDIISGEKVLDISFTNDYYEEGLGDSNLKLIDFTVTDLTGDTVFYLHFKDIESVKGVTYSCGGPSNPGFDLWCDGTVSVPFPIELAGEYNFVVGAYGDQAGPSATQMVVAVNASDPKSSSTNGALAIKAVIVNLHNRLLGQSLDITNPEIDMTYQYLVDSWHARKNFMTEKNNTGASQYPDESCNWYSDEQTSKDGISGRINDPSGMKSSWQSVLAYLMTDFNYLHE